MRSSRNCAACLVPRNYAAPLLAEQYDQCPAVRRVLQILFLRCCVAAARILLWSFFRRLALHRFAISRLARLLGARARDVPRCGARHCLDGNGSGHRRRDLIPKRDAGRVRGDWRLIRRRGDFFKRDVCPHRKRRRRYGLNRCGQFLFHYRINNNALVRCGFASIGTSNFSFHENGWRIWPGHECFIFGHYERRRGLDHAIIVCVILCANVGG